MLFDPKCDLPILMKWIVLKLQVSQSEFCCVSQTIIAQVFTLFYCNACTFSKFLFLIFIATLVSATTTLKTLYEAATTFARPLHAQQLFASKADHIFCPLQTNRTLRRSSEA